MRTGRTGASEVLQGMGKTGMVDVAVAGPLSDSPGLLHAVDDGRLARAAGVTGGQTGGAGRQTEATVAGGHRQTFAC